MSQKIQSPCYKRVVCFLCDGTHSPAHPSCGSPKSTQAGHPKWLQADMTIQALWGDGAMILQSKYIYIYIWVLNDTFWFLWTSWNPFISKNLHNIKSTCIHRSLDIQIHYEHMLSIDFKGPTIFSGGVFVCLAYVTQLLLHPVLQWFVLCILQMQDVDEFQNSG